MLSLVARGVVPMAGRFSYLLTDDDEVGTGCPGWIGERIDKTAAPLHPSLWWELVEHIQRLPEHACDPIARYFHVRVRTLNDAVRIAASVWDIDPRVYVIAVVWFRDPTAIGADDSSLGALSGFL